MLLGAMYIQAVEDMCLHKMADRLYAGLQQVNGSLACECMCALSMPL